ncbi:two-component system OmpR family response regulator [Phyllobacterium endophyticum]|nr:two-component system OmpR family response regulator [Phyllobacterium endophyticum]
MSMKSEAHILIVDDDQAIRDLLHDFLKKRGMHVSVARDDDEMQEVLSRTPIDLLILDVMLPGKSGMEICRDIRKHSRIPIIMLTAVTETTDRVVGLEMGADDYVSKPFDPRELLARIRAVLRRLDTSSAERRLEPSVYHFAGWTMDCSRRRLVSPDAVRVELTTAEFNLLETLVKSTQRMLSRDQLLELVGNSAAYGYDRSIDILISRLRRKMEDDSRSPKLISTIRGGGYQFLPEVSTE